MVKCAFCFLFLRHYHGHSLKMSSVYFRNIKLQCLRVGKYVFSSSHLYRRFSFCLALPMEIQNYLLGKDCIKLFLTDSEIGIFTCRPHIFLAFIGGNSTAF